MRQRDSEWTRGAGPRARRGLVVILLAALASWSAPARADAIGAPLEAEDAVVELVAQEERARELAVQAAGVPAGSAAADAHFERVMAELGKVRPEVEAALREAAAPADAADPGAPERAAARLDGLVRVEASLDGARLLLLERLPGARRDEVLGEGRAGQEQLRWEIWRVSARARWYGLRRRTLPGEIVAALRDPFVLVPWVARGLWVLLVVIAAIVVARRGRRMLEAARVPRIASWPRLRRGLERAREVLAALWPELVLLGGLRGVRWAIGGGAAAVRGVELAYALLLGYALYRLGLAAVHRFIVWRSGQDGASMGKATDHKVLGSLRLVGRYVLFAGLLLAVIEAELGAGYLHDLAHQIAWAGAVPVGWILVRRWRGDIAEAYLRRHSEGVLARAVDGSRRRWYGLFVVLLAFSALALAAGGRSARRFALGFEQSHRVLAFVFRKRLERRADAIADDDAALPADLVACFSEEPLEDPALGVDHHPGLDRFEAALASWRAEPRLGALLLVGGFGSGKTTWLAAASRKASGVPVRRIALRRRVLTSDDLLAAFAAGLGAPPEALAGVEDLAAWIRSEGRQVLIIDDLEHLFLRGLDAWGAWDAFLELVELSGRSAFWLCAIAKQPYRYLCFVRGGADIFRMIVSLPPWSELELTGLIRKRMAASGYDASYDDMVLDEEPDADREAHVSSAERDYMRLLWDYTLGCPRVALHFWRCSLAPVPGEERRVRVRLFRGPDEEELESLSEAERFALACVVWHDSLTAGEAARSLRFPTLLCEDAMAKLTERRILESQGGRHRVTTRWHSATHGYLLRKHLVQP